MIIRVCICIVLYFQILSLVGQAPSHTIYNYTVDDGLPSNEIHDVVQDSLGYMWIATDRGLVRYDGYDFKVYGAAQGLKNMTCLKFAIDQYQNIWILTLGGEVYIYNRAGDSISKYKYQLEIDKYLLSGQAINIYRTSKNELIITTSAIGVIRVNEKGVGNLLRIENEDPRSKVHREVFEFEDHLTFIVQGNSGPPLYEYVPGEKYGKILRFRNKEFSILNGNHEYSKSRVNRIGRETICVSMLDNNYFIRNDSLIGCIESEFVMDISTVADDGFVVVLYGKVVWVESIESLLNQEYDIIIEHGLFNRSYVDREGDIWIASLSRGLMRISKSGGKVERIKIFDGEYITDCIERNDMLYAILGKKSLVKYNSGKLSTIVSVNNVEIKEFIKDECTGRVIVSGHGLFELLDDAIEERQVKGKTRNRAITTVKFLKEYSCDYMVAVCWHDLERYTISGLDYSVKETKNYNNNLVINDVVLTSNNGGILATNKGLLKLNGISVELWNDVPTKLSSRINSIIPINDGYLFGTIGYGLVYWDLQSEMIHLDKSTGLVSDNVEEVIVIDNNVVVSSKSGISIISGFFDEKRLIHNVNRHHGLPSNEVTCIVEWKHGLLVGTSKGLATVDLTASLAPINNVLVEEVWANEAQVHVRNKETTTLDYNQNDIVIKYKTIDFRMTNALLYRYRLNQAPWNETKITQINFTDLPPGSYDFDVQAINRDDVWGATTSHKFEIKKPWWQTYVFYAVSLLLFTYLIYFLYRNQVRRIEQQRETETEIRELEKSALQAQMNPHFIFNCLNSIQSFIMSNEKESAMEYLTQFAKLVRGTLNSSVNSTITLDEEIDILNNYLSLEQLRCNNSFTYKVSYSGIIDKYDLVLPPMLIQPFVENAVIHGIQGMKEDGVIEVLFSQEEGSLQAMIKDNGGKKDEDSQVKGYKSMGMNITRNRLARINKVDVNELDMSYESTKEGTTVIVKIPILGNVA